MAPGTNLGAATPVQMGGPGLPGLGDKGDKAEQGKDKSMQPPVSAMEKKVVNDAVAYVQSLAQLRGRNAEWAEQAVRQGVSLSAEDALDIGVIDLIATSTGDLLDQVHGRDIQLAGAAHTLNTRGLALHRHEIDWRSEFLAVITNPNVAYILMLVGIYGLLLEFYNPGVGLPGVMGAICLLLALYAFQALPISYAGLGLIVLGVALMTAEVFAPSFGVLGLGGIGAFVMGSIMLMDTELPGYQIAMPIIIGFALFTAVLLIFALGLVLRARRAALVSGVEHLAGAAARVESVQDGTAWVRLEGELWSAACDEELAPDDRVTVQSVHGVTLQVSKCDQG
jgi:membrane-bound serine protease (ClpP class)